MLELIIPSVKMGAGGAAAATRSHYLPVLGVGAALLVGFVGWMVF